MKISNNFRSFVKHFMCSYKFLVKTFNEEKRLVDQEDEQYKNNGVKRSFKDEYNQDFKRGIVSVLLDNNYIYMTFSEKGLTLKMKLAKKKKVVHKVRVLKIFIKYLKVFVVKKI